jgi:hypothetical protein
MQNNHTNSKQHNNISKTLIRLAIIIINIIIIIKANLNGKRLKLKQMKDLGKGLKNMNINNNSLEVDTRSKLNNEFYKGTLDLIYRSYPFLDPNADSIERYILREFFKFGFRDPDHNGYWIKQQQMTYPAESQVFYVDFGSFYDIDKLENTIRQLEVFVNLSFDFSAEFYQEYKRFLSFIPYCDHKSTCDRIVQAVLDREDILVPPLTLFQESYINGTLERLFQREMPFHQPDYFTSTKDMLYYINHTAPNL